MRFLIDECCDAAVGRALKAAGHDVLAVSYVAPQADDDQIAERARREKRILLTEDKDFGRLVYAAARKTAGVIFARYPASVRKSLPAAVIDLVRQQGEALIGCFVVLEPGRVRIRRQPD